MKALISVRSVAEALVAADAGATLIDCKEPRAGALGALPVRTVRDIVVALRGRCVEISATLGDAPADLPSAAAAMAAAGVDLLKAAVTSSSDLQRLTALRHRVAPVLLADAGALADDALIEQACRAFDTVMLDTLGKRNGSLFDIAPASRLRRFVDQARRHGRRVGLAGALGTSDLPRLHELEPDFAGFRGAVCVGGDRAGALDPQRIAELLAGCVSRAPAAS